MKLDQFTTSELSAALAILQKLDRPEITLGFILWNSDEVLKLLINETLDAALSVENHKALLISILGSLIEARELSAAVNTASSSSGNGGWL